MNWLLTLFWSSSGGFSSVQKVGDRVRTPHGLGTIVGGTIHIKLDVKVNPKTHKNDKTISFNLDNIKNWR